MKRKALVFLVLAAILVSPIAAADLDEIIQQNIEARGGLEAIQAVQSVRATGTMSMMGGQMEAPFTWEWKRPNKFRLEFKIQGQSGIQGYDGETAWMHMPFMGKADPEVLPEEDARQVEDQADMIDGPFIDTEEKGYTLEYMGEEEVDGTPVHKIKVTNKHGDVTYNFLDAEYFLSIKEEGKRKQGETEMEFESIVGDYKEVAGLIMPHSIEARPKGAPAGQAITIDQFEFGVEIDDERFTLPEVEAPEATEPESDGGS